MVEGIIGIPFSEFSEALNLTVGRWWTLLERHSNFLSQTVREKIMLALLDLGRKFGQRDEHAMIVNLGLSGQDIANWWRLAAESQRVPQSSLQKAS